MRRVAWLAKCLQSAEIRASPVIPTFSFNGLSPTGANRQDVQGTDKGSDHFEMKDFWKKTIQLTLFGRCDIRNHTPRRFCMVPGLTRPCHPLLAVLLTLAAAIPLHADVTGSILGIVTDSSG